MSILYSKLSLEFPDEESVELCAECDSEEGIQRVGEDSLNYCSECQSIEGDTIIKLVRELGE